MPAADGGGLWPHPWRALPTVRASYMPSVSCTKVYRPRQEHLVVPPKAISGESRHLGITRNTTLVTAMSHREYKEAASPRCL